MKTLNLVALPLAALLGFASVSRAEKDADLKLLISKASKTVAPEKFDGPKLPKGWVVNKGDFQIREGMLVGWEKKEDMHAAVLTLQKPFKNSILRFSFKRDGATGFNVSLNHPKGHLFRILINDDGLQINKDKDKNDAASKPLVLGKAEGKFPPGQWQTLQIEIVGDKVAVQADNGVKLEVSNPALAVEKTGYRFVLRGSKLLLDDVSVWDVQP
jgi:3-keto-disaccharide hydrolase